MDYLNNIVRCTIVFLSGLFLVVSLSPALQQKIAQKGWIPDQYRYGDLYNTSNLEKFKELDYYKNSTLLPSDKPKTKYSDIDLFTIGDSFTPMDTSFYAGNRNHHIWLGVNVETVRLDPAKKSILVIEVIERTIQERLKSDYKSLYIDKGFQIEGKSKPIAEQKGKGESSFWWNKFGDQVNQRIEFLFFNFKPFLTLKEFKSDIMLSWFGRTHTGAIISKDHKHLFYNVEADPKTELSPFYPIAAESIDTVVANMNKIRDYYKAAGFREVYFCFIPNKVTTFEKDGPNAYNHQIARIESHTNRKAPVLSVYETVSQRPDWYHLGDGHWTAEGQRYWLKVVNALVKEWDEKTAGKQKKTAGRL